MGAGSCVFMFSLFFEIFFEVDAMAVLAHNVAFFGLITMVIGAVSAESVTEILLSRSVGAVRSIGWYLRWGSFVDAFE